MERAAYRLFYDNIHDFKTAAMNVESEIIRHGIRSGSNDSVPGMNGRTHHDMWVSMKTVSHFNLGTALESMLKLLAFLNKIAIPQHHFLTNLHDAIPAKCQKQLESTYQASESVLPGRLEADRIPQYGIALTCCSVRAAEPGHFESQGVLRVFRQGRHTLAEALFVGTRRGGALAPLHQRHCGFRRTHKPGDG